LENAGTTLSGDSKLTDRLIAVSRVAKVVKGGRRFGFNALVAVGDGAGSVGIGMGKANDVTDAIRKAVENAKKNVLSVSVIDGTIPHEIIGRFGAAQILLKPAGPGTGVIAGGPARAVLELVGVRNILTKCIGTTNAHNVIKATMNGLTRLKTREQIRILRQLPVHEKTEVK
jgi:small subunit ribosomal protein S5